MDNLERAAIILLGMEKDQAAQVMKHFSPNEVEKLAVAMKNISDLDDTQIDDTLKSFFALSEKKTMPKKRFHARLTKTITPSYSGNYDTSVNTQKNVDSVSSEEEILFPMRAAELFDMLKSESPQVIAMLITYLNSEKAAEFLEMLDEKKRVDVIRRVACINVVSPLALELLKNLVDEKKSEMKQKPEVAKGGPKAAATILSYMDAETESYLIKELKITDERLGEEVLGWVLSFDDLAKIHDRHIKILLREVQEETLVMSLKLADDGLKNIFFRNMTKQDSAMLQEQMDLTWPVKIKDVLIAQKKVISIAQRLARSGEIVFNETKEEI